MTNRPAAAVMALAVTLGGCASSDIAGPTSENGDGSTPSTAAPSTAAPSTAAPSTAAPSTAAPSTAAPSTTVTADTTLTSTAARSLSTDAEPGLQWDIGWIRGLLTNDGSALVEFERARVPVDGALASAPDLPREVKLFPVANQEIFAKDAVPRRYPLAEDHRLLITATEELESGVCLDVPPADKDLPWIPVTFNELDESFPVASLTFNGDGEISLVRFMLLCTDFGAEADPEATETHTDAEPGLRFDVGKLVDVEVGDGRTRLVFDRYQAYSEEGRPISGLDLTEEYLLGAATDFPFANTSERLRRYPAREEVKVLELDPAWLAGQDEFCGGDGSATGRQPRYVDVGSLVKADWAPVASLTFDDRGRVIRVRFMPGC